MRTYLVVGASRGIGLALVKEIVRPSLAHHFVAHWNYPAQ